MPLILDTDMLSIWESRSRPAFDRFQARLNQHPSQSIATTIISFQERVQGWMSFLNQARTTAKVLAAYHRLESTLKTFCDLHVVAFDQPAQDHFADLKQQRVRIGTLDLRIASIALALDATLLSRNVRDFRKVPGLRVEDWTQ
jgi:tRNA(fMet)-specific endonuclease VapC